MKRTTQQKLTFITIRATDSLEKRVRKLAVAEKRTMSQMAFLLIEEALNARLLMDQAVKSLREAP